MSIVTVMAKIKAKKDSVEIAKKEFLKLTEPTRKEEGCIEYNLHQDNEDPAVFVFFENWASDIHLEKHMNTAHFKSFSSVIEGMVEEVVIQKMTRIA